MHDQPVTIMINFFFILESSLGLGTELLGYVFLFHVKLLYAAVIVV